jgi:regulator of CtrA degradation
MTSSVDKSAGKAHPDNTVSFGAHFAQSDQFDVVFKEGMALVERTAAYLDGQGRKEAKALVSPLTLVYATESMRLTTRLLELASWLLIRRGVKDGELTAEEADARRARVKLAPLGRPGHVKGFAELPDGLRELIESSFALNDRILKLDQAINMKDVAPAEANPVDGQVARIRAAFAVVGGTDVRH